MTPLPPPDALVPTLAGTVEALIESLAGGASGVVVDGAPTLVLLTAPVGAGLTTVVRTFAARCGPGADVDAAAVHRRIGLPWEAADDGALLAGLVAPVGDRPGATADRWLEELAAEREARAPVPDRDAVVLVEDAQHADAFTVQTLVSATRRPGAPRVLVVLPWTATDADADGLPAAVRSAADLVIGLPPLVGADVQVLAGRRGLSLSTARADQMVGFTGGNTRQLVELLSGLPAGGDEPPLGGLPVPVSVTRRVATRLAGVGAGARTLALAVAVLQSADPLARGVDVAAATAVAGPRTGPSS